MSYSSTRRRGRSVTALSLPGVSGNYASAPDEAALDIVGDIDLRIAVAMNDWTPSAQKTLIGKAQGTGDQRSYNLDVIATTGTIRLRTTADGLTAVTNTSSVAPTIADGAALLLRVTLDVNDGGGNRVAKFYTKPANRGTFYADVVDHDGWTQLGATVTTAAITSIYAGTANLEIGSLNDGTGQLAIGKVFAAAVFSGIAGSLVYGVDFSRGPAGATLLAAQTYQAVTINQSGADPASIVTGISLL